MNTKKKTQLQHFGKRAATTFLLEFPSLKMKQNFYVRIPHTGNFDVIGQTVWQVICYAGTKLPVSHVVHAFARTKSHIITSETVEKIYSCKSKGSYVSLIDNSWVDSTELVASPYSRSTYCYYHCIIWQEALCRICQAACSPTPKSPVWRIPA